MHRGSGQGAGARGKGLGARGKGLGARGKGPGQGARGSGQGARGKGVEFLCKSRQVAKHEYEQSFGFLNLTSEQSSLLISPERRLSACRGGVGGEAGGGERPKQGYFYDSHNKDMEMKHLCAIRGTFSLLPVKKQERDIERLQERVERTETERRDEEEEEEEDRIKEERRGTGKGEEEEEERRRRRRRGAGEERPNKHTRSRGKL
ncbi:hypothetical protein EYF80_017176 [Liparis tanakae]|uniref:Uncharacterized protein n=1 Tax=Liparis tanakae TaxID=230148 RepID=A0A4Z2I3C7_9TELE|nr:hypothetical protein EYF80_017176 [Liparis tanakae]